MNAKQEEMLRLHGHDVIAIDYINSVQSTGCTLQKLLVIDEFTESYPAVFAIDMKSY